MLTTLNYFNYNREVTLNKKKVVILFGAPWCLGCQQMLPKYERWARDYPDFDFKLADITKTKYLVNKFKVVSSMTFVVISRGVEIKRFNGIQTDETFKYFLLNK